MTKWPLMKFWSVGVDTDLILCVEWRNNLIGWGQSGTARAVAAIESVKI